MTTGTERGISASAVLPPTPAPAVSAQTSLCFADDTADFRTPFRDYVLNLAYTAACRELGDALQSADVSVYRNHWEPAPPLLTLSIMAAVDGSEFGRVHRALAQAVGAAAASWSDVERADYAQSIHFELVPLPRRLDSGFRRDDG